MAENYSEDYQKILEYKNSVGTDDFELAEEDAVNFFYNKYEEDILNSYKKMTKLVAVGHSHDSGLNYDELSHFSLMKPDEELYKENMKNKYLRQALNSFNPEIITNKDSYRFITYLNYYFRHAQRDEAKNFRNTLNSIPVCSEQESSEDKLIREDEERRLNECFDKLIKKLKPIEIQVLGYMRAGVPQKDMVIINEKTGERYQKSYISKLVKRITLKIKKMMKMN